MFTTFGIDNYAGFILASIILNITPGLDTFYILTRSICQGKRAGMVSVAGIMSGCVVHVLCAAFGLSLILTTSALVFTVVKWAGAIYLIYMGIKILRDKKPAFDLSEDQCNAEEQDLMKIYKQGVITNVLNPKVALFFLSFLPQFIHAGSAASLGPVPFLILGATFLVTGTIWFSTLNYSAARITRAMRDDDRIGERLKTASGIVFIAFGVKLALETR